MGFWNRKKELMDEAKATADRDVARMLKVIEETDAGTYELHESVRRSSGKSLKDFLYEIEHQNELGVHIDFKYPGGIEGLRRDVAKEEQFE